MKTFAKIAATLLLTAAIVPAVFAQAPSAAPASSKMSGTAIVAKKLTPGKKGGYVHATTYTNKAGKTVHRKGYYRHSTKSPISGKKATPVAATTAPAGKM